MDFESPVVTIVPDFDESPIPHAPQLDIVEISREDYLQKRIDELRQMGIDSYEDIKTWWPKVDTRA